MADRGYSPTEHVPSHSSADDSSAAHPRRADFLLLVSGQMVSVFGSSLHLVVVILFLKELTGQAFALGIFQFTAYLPVILLSPLGGVAADGYAAKRILVAADLLRGAAMLAMGLLLRQELLSYGLLLAGTFIVSLGTAFFQPAVHALFPAIVERGFIRRGNSIRGATLLGANFAGTSLGGLAFALLGPTAVFLINGGSFIVSAAEEGFIRAPADPERAPAQSIPSLLRGVRERLRETAGYLQRDRGALSAILTYGMIHAVYPPVVLALPFFLEEELGMGSVPYGYAMALLLAGGGAGALLYGFAAPRGRGNVPLLFGALVLLSVLLGVVGAVPRTAVLFPALPAAGACIGAVHQIMTTSLYHRVRAGSRGRVFGLMESLASAALPLSYAASGMLLGLFRGRLPFFFLLVAGVSLLTTAAVYLRGRLARFVSWQQETNKNNQNK